MVRIKTRLGVSFVLILVISLLIWVELNNRIMDSDFQLVASYSSRDMAGGQYSVNQARLIDEKTVLFSSIVDHGIYRLDLVGPQLNVVGAQGVDYVSPAYFCLSDSLIFYADITSPDIRCLSLAGKRSAFDSKRTSATDKFVIVSDTIVGINACGLGTKLIYFGSEGFIRRDHFVENGSHPGIPSAGLVRLDDVVYFMLLYKPFVYRFNVRSKREMSPIHVAVPLDYQRISTRQGDSMSAPEFFRTVSENPDLMIGRFDISCRTDRIILILQIGRTLWFADKAGNVIRKAYLGDFVYCSCYRDYILIARSGKSMEFRVYRAPFLDERNSDQKAVNKEDDWK